MTRQARFSFAVPAAAAAAVLSFCFLYGARVAGGSDAFGYVSQALLWLSGDLGIDQPLAAELPWPHPRESLTPLAYRPAFGTTIVPIVSIGVPLMMAAMQALVGSCGPYTVAPLLGAVLVLATAVLGTRLTGDRRVGAVASVLIASSPAFLMNVVVPWSDTACAAMWTLSLAALTWRGRGAAALAGILAGVAILTRANLVPLLAAGALAAEHWRGAGVRRGLRPVVYVVCALPAVALVAAVNNHLYGSPLVSGYGQTTGLYSLRFAGINLRHFVLWLLQTEHVVILILAGALWTQQARASVVRRPFVPFLAFGLLVVASYAFYLPFDPWWYLRFLLPAFPLAFVAAAAAAAGLSELFTGRRSTVALIGIAMVSVIVHIAPYIKQIAYVGRLEDRYAAVAQFIDRALPSNAIVLTVQHSGSVRLYSGRMTVRYDTFEGPRLPNAVTWLRDRGFHPYLLLEEWEEPAFRSRYGEFSDVGRLNIGVVAEMWEPVFVRLYDPLARSGDKDAFKIVLRRRTGCPAPSPNWRTPQIPPSKGE